MRYIFERLQILASVTRIMVVNQLSLLSSGSEATPTTPRSRGTQRAPCSTEATFGKVTHRLRKILLLSLFFGLLCHPNVKADILVSLQGLPDSLKYGDPFKLQISVDAPADGKLILPDWNQALSPFELLSPPDTTQQKILAGRKQLNITLNATCYEAGRQTLNPIVFKWANEAGVIQDSASTQSQTVMVRGIVPEAILAAADTTQQPNHLLRPNRQWKLGYSLVDFYIYFLILIGSAGLFFLIRWFIRKQRRKTVAVVVGPPPKPAHIIALQALDNLRDQQLYQAGRIKEYYSELSEIIRRYLEARYNIPAMESTSFQLLRDIEAPLHDRNQVAALETLLTDADFAKFAKHQPDANTCQQDLERAYLLVNKTKPEDKPLLSREAA